MRYLLIALVLVLLPLMAFGADGNYAKFTITFELSPEMQAMMEETGGGQNEMGGMFSDPMTGEMWWTDNNVRMEMILPGMMAEEDMSELIMLVDIPGNMMHMLNPTAMEAMEFDLAEMTESGGAGMMGMDPTEMTGDWMKNIEQLKAQPGTIVKELGKATVDGKSCLHYSFEVDPEQMEEPMPGGDESLAGMLGAFGGEIWVIEDSGIPIKFITSIMGMNMTYLLTDMKAWTPTEGIFDVPEDYTLVSMEDMMEEQMAPAGAEG